MNEIRNNGVNLSTVSLGQIQHMTQSSPAKQADELESMLNRTLGSSSTASAQSGELSLDVIMSGSLNGYLGVGETAMSSLESPLASAQVLSPSVSVAAAQEGSLNLSLEPAASSTGTIKIAHTEEVNKTGTIQIAKVDLDGPINTIKIAKVDVNGPINAIKIAKIDSDSPSVLSKISSPDSPLAALPSETLSNVAFSMEVNEVALGLVPGENFTPSQSQAIAAALAPGAAPSETIAAAPAGTINPQTAATGQIIEDLAVNLPAETIADWERSKPVALTDNQVSYGGLSLDVPTSLSAMALEKGENFDAVAMVSLPVVEGNRNDYKNAWNGMNDTLSAYEGTSSQGVIGLAEFNGPAGINSNTLGLNLDTDSNSLIGINDVDKPKELLGYSSFVSKDLLGYMDRASYSSLIGYNVHPTSIVSALNPGKYISNMLYGYNS